MRTFAAAGSVSVDGQGVIVRRLDDPDLTYQHSGSGHLLRREPRVSTCAARSSLSGYDHAGPSWASSRRGACVVGARNCVGVVQGFRQSAVGFGRSLRAPKVAEGFMMGSLLATAILILLLAFVPFDIAILSGGEIAGSLALAALIEHIIGMIEMGVRSGSA